MTKSSSLLLDLVTVLDYSIYSLLYVSILLIDFIVLLLQVKLLPLALLSIKVIAASALN